MKDFDLLAKASDNLIRTISKLKVEAETAYTLIETHDKLRRIDGEPIEGEVQEYCRCGKKDCPELGTAGHTTRFQLQTPSGKVHIKKANVERYKQAAENNKKYHEALKKVESLKETVEKVYKALGYIGRDRTFESYLKSFV